jgi:hypothetical protein
MTIRRAIAVALAGLVIWLVIRLSRSGVDPRPAEVDQRSQRSTPATATATATATPRPAAERSTLADALNSPATDIYADLRIVSDIFETFRTNFPREGNPVGNNIEITAALTGHNKLRLPLIPRDHAAINQAGELCDRWGTPFFFHAESATRMEIRSAGPDRRMWSADDVTFTP